jgi:peptide/nickel transport system permease protein
VRKAAATALAVVGAVALVSLFLDLVPGDPVDIMLGERAAAVDREALRHAVGLDRPWYAQLAIFTKELCTGELRSSLPPFQKKVLPLVGSALPYTLLLAFAAMLIGVMIAVPLGVLAAARRGSAIDHLAMGIAIAGVAIPRFWLGPMLIILFAIRLDLFPVSGAGSLRHLVLPAVTLGVALAAFLSRITRASMLEVLGEEYVMVARAKGLSRARVIWKHAFRNALLPILTVLGLEFGTLLGGAIVIEKVFAWPGMGTLLLNGIGARDYNLVRVVVLAFTLSYLAVNALTDLAYAVVDPRVRGH